MLKTQGYILPNNEVQRPICYKIHAFKFEQFLSTSQT